MPQDIFDVIIIGAGATGLMAAWELAQVDNRVVIAEARERVGGRIHTLHDAGFDLPIEQGAEFIHGNLELTQLLLKKAGVKWYEVTGDIWRKQEDALEKESDFIEDYSLLHKKFKELQEDLPVSEFLERHLTGSEYEDLKISLKSYVEGYYAADPARASTYALWEELEKGDEEQYRIEGGYKTLLDFLTGELERRGCPLLLSAPAYRINWNTDPIEVHTAKGLLRGKKLIVTVPLGVLQSEQLSFTPALTEKIAAAKALGFGPVIKVILQFRDAFWKHKDLTSQKDLSGAGFIFSSEQVPTWWTQQPVDASILTGWLAGPNAEKAKHLSEEDLLQKALMSLGNIFTMEPNKLREGLSNSRICNWAADPFCGGGYSYEVVGGAEWKQILKAPLEEKLFFAGEALYDGIEGGTVEAALVSGRDTAHQVIAAF